MKTNTSKIKKLVLGLLVVGFALGTSAFTNVRVQYTFYNTSSNPNSVDPNDYEYRTDKICTSPEVQNCSVTEDLSNPPSEGDHPSEDAMSNITEGTISDL